MLRRDHWQKHHATLDPVDDAHEIALNVGSREFPWDTVTSLSFALFRTFAVPSVGRLLHSTGEFTERTQRRYDDTSLLIEHALRFGLGSREGRAAVRRINRVHSPHDISNDDLRYVLSTFIVVPARWIERFGYRPLTDVERDAGTQYYIALGHLMGIKDIPTSFAEFAQLMDSYESENFAFDPGSRAVADATLDLVATFRPYCFAPRWVVRRFAYVLMDQPLRDAFRYPKPTLPERLACLGLLELRRRLLRLMPARERQKFSEDFGYIRSYPDGHAVDQLGPPSTLPTDLAG
ncbi:MAG TPA: oxygenase MpaB family protein [Aeromicrobium sp.]|nr:oxygenase MpaB family protein [Aeromicrobium sp.]